MTRPATGSQLLDMAATLEPPWVLLEDGLGKGTSILAWGAEERFRLPWSRTDLGVLDRLGPGPWFGAIAYDAGLPPRAVLREPMIAQPMIDVFRPARIERLMGGKGDKVGMEGRALPPLSPLPP